MLFGAAPSVSIVSGIAVSSDGSMLPSSGMRLFSGTSAVWIASLGSASLFFLGMIFTPLAYLWAREKLRLIIDHPLIVAVLGAVVDGEVMRQRRLDAVPLRQGIQQKEQRAAAGV
jgi:hypothetical protein